MSYVNPEGEFSRDTKYIDTRITADGADGYPVEPGRYRLVAETGAWFSETGRDTLYPCAQIDFLIGETADEHFHLPFVIAPGGWSTYRGS